MESRDSVKRHILLRRNFFNRDYITPILIFYFSSLFIVALVFSGWVDPITSSVSLFNKFSLTTRKTHKIPIFSLNCIKENVTKFVCPRTYPTRQNTIHSSHSSSLTCPSYFRWIHEDLRPWKETGITTDMVNKAQDMAHFRLVIINGKAYFEKLREAFQSRDIFTLWGIVQLLRVYPGRLPDLELMFNCNDLPVVLPKDYINLDSRPPPLFKYCSEKFGLDIVFPDWTFWGWPELKIKPWKNVLEDAKESNKRKKWKERVPYAYWKGNHKVSSTRYQLLKCNASHQYDWNARLYKQDWVEEGKQDYKQSNVAEQCTHRYKIYIEGRAWSVSEKYIMACDSMTLYIRPNYYDFFTRGMEPLKHYWPTRGNVSMCSSIKFAVEWGNNQTDKAEAIGKAGSKFIQEELKMEYVYDYMFHLLNEYSKLLKFKPTIPSGAVEVCSEVLACSANGTSKSFMLDSLVKSPSETNPCTLPPHDPQLLHDFEESKSNSIRKVEIWEDEFWKKIVGKNGSLI